MDLVVKIVNLLEMENEVLCYSNISHNALARILQSARIIFVKRYHIEMDEVLCLLQKFVKIK